MNQSMVHFLTVPRNFTLSIKLDHLFFGGYLPDLLSEQFSSCKAPQSCCLFALSQVLHNSELFKDYICTDAIRIEAQVIQQHALARSLCSRTHCNRQSSKAPDKRVQRNVDTSDSLHRIPRSSIFIVSADEMSRTRSGSITFTKYKMLTSHPFLFHPVFLLFFTCKINREDKAGTKSKPTLLRSTQKPACSIFSLAHSQIHAF